MNAKKPHVVTYIFHFKSVARPVMLPGGDDEPEIACDNPLWLSIGKPGEFRVVTARGALACRGEDLLCVHVTRVMREKGNDAGSRKTFLMFEGGCTVSLTYPPEMPKEEFMDMVAKATGPGTAMFDTGTDAVYYNPRKLVCAMAYDPAGTAAADPKPPQAEIEIE